MCATVHQDIEGWLKPCWVFDTQRNEFAQGPGPPTSKSCKVADAKLVSSPDDVRLWKPAVIKLNLNVVANHSTAQLWQAEFKDHHYLSGSLSTISDGCFVVQEQGSGRLVAFHAVNLLPGKRTLVREHRLVVRPEWQGFGIGPMLSNILASRWAACFAKKGFAFSSKTAHPRLGEMRQQDPSWRPTEGNLTINRNKNEFGEIGFARKKTARATLSQGSVVKVSDKEHRICLHQIPQVHAEVDIALPRDARQHVEEVLGISFYGMTLKINRISALALSGELPCSQGWSLFSVNGERIDSREELAATLSNWAHVSHVVFQYDLFKSDDLRGPLRKTMGAAEADLDWIVARSLAKASLHAELEQLRALLQQLKGTDGENCRLPPTTPEIPLELSPELAQACKAFGTASKQNRLCYSHIFTGLTEQERRKAWLSQSLRIMDRYQIWMRLRAPQLRTEGKTWQAAMDAARLEFESQTALEFLWSEVHRNKNFDMEHLEKALGLRVDESCAVQKPRERGPAVRRGLNAVISNKVVAVQRGSEKMSVTSADELLERLEALRSVQGDFLWIYTKCIEEETDV